MFRKKLNLPDETEFTCATGRCQGRCLDVLHHPRGFVLGQRRRTSMRNIRFRQLGVAAVLAVAVVTAAASPALAGVGINLGVGVPVAPAYVAPPPAVYAPPPVAYAPPPTVYPAPPPLVPAPPFYG